MDHEIPFGMKLKEGDLEAFSPAWAEALDLPRPKRQRAPTAPVPAAPLSILETTAVVRL